MPFFNFRRGQPAAAAAGSGAQTESVDVMRKRAKHRLIGAVVLVLAGVIGFPLLFDTQPRPVAVDIPIEIPSKAAVKPQGSLSYRMGDERLIKVTQAAATKVSSGLH